MEGDVSIEILKESDPIANQDWKDRIANFVGQPPTKAFGGEHTAANKPDITERRAQASIDELRQIAGVKLNAIAGPWQFATGKDENGFVAIRPPESLGFKTKRGLIRSRSHNVAANCLEECLDEFWVHGLPAREFV
jgi:hypothetical protein